MCPMYIYTLNLYAIVSRSNYFVISCFTLFVVVIINHNHFEVPHINLSAMKYGVLLNL